MQRREFLGILCGASVALAGCLGEDGSGAAGTDTSDAPTTEPTEPTETTRAPTTTETERPTTTQTATTGRPETPTATDTPTTTRHTTTWTTDTDAPVTPTETTTTGTGAPTTDDRTHEATTTPRTGNATVQVRDTEFTVGSDIPSGGGDAGGSDGSDGSDRGGGPNKTDEPGTADAASVAFDPAANRVVVAGTIVGENGCQTATLESARYDAQGGLLTITIGTERDAPKDAMCTMALVELPYEATVSLEDGLPKRVSVIHHGAGTSGEVATATRER